MLPTSASEYWLGQQRVSAATLAVVKRLWRRMGRDFDASWDAMSPALVAAIEQAQMSSAVLAKDFVPAVLDEQNLDVDPVAEVDPSRFTGVTGGGVPLEQALYASVVQAKTGVTRGMGFEAALQLGGSYLEMLTRTVLSDTGRAVESVGITTRPSVGYVRMLNPPSCSRCVILAGRFYRYSAGFRRHPGCDCRHVASTKAVAEDISVDPTRYFNSLTTTEQDKAFTRAGAQAIRDGADMSQVVNASKGMQRAQIYGRELAYTTEGTTKRGVAGKVIRARGRNPVTTPRLMPDAIYQIAESREDAVRLLRLNGYVLDRSGPVVGVGSRTNLVPDLRPSTPIDLDPVPRRISERQGRALGRGTWFDYADSMSPEDAKQVRVYTGNSYEVLNSALRSNELQLLTSAQRSTIDTLDRVIDRAPRVPEPLTVSRAVGADVFGLTKDSDISSVIGKPFRDDAFVSTALQSRLSGIERHEVEVRLDVPAGARGLYVSGHRDGDEKSLAMFGPGENELILGRGVDYVFDDAFVENGRRVLRGRVVGQDGGFGGQSQ